MARRHRSHLGRALAARDWCRNLQSDPSLVRLQKGRFDRFDGKLSLFWWLRYLSAKPGAPYLLAGQKPKHYLPSLEARPWWSQADSIKDVEQKLESRWETIREEFRNLQDSCRPYPATPGWVEGNGWNSLWLYHGKFYENIAQQCPKTLEVIETLNHCGDSLGGVFFSALKGKTTIKPHFGPTNARLRLHLGLVVPEDCWLEVDGEKRTWKEGQCLCFDDSFLHQAHNGSEQERVVLIVDLWHPELSEEEISALKEGWSTWGPVARLPKF